MISIALAGTTVTKIFRDPLKPDIVILVVQRSGQQEFVLLIDKNGNFVSPDKL